MEICFKKLRGSGVHTSHHRRSEEWNAKFLFGREAGLTNIQSFASLGLLYHEGWLVTFKWFLIMGALKIRWVASCCHFWRYQQVKLLPAALQEKESKWGEKLNSDATAGIVIEDCGIAWLLYMPPQTFFFFFKLFIFFVLLSFIVREILCISQDTDHQHTAREERSSTVHRQPAGT